MPGYNERTISPKLCDRVLAQSTHLFWFSMLEKSTWPWFMDGLLKLKLTKKRENTMYLWNTVYQLQTDINHHHECWLGVTIKYIAATWEKL